MLTHRPPVHRTNESRPAVVAHHDHTVRIAACAGAVWDEVSSLDSVLSYFRGIGPFTVDGPDRATVIGTFALGTYRAVVTGQVRVTERTDLTRWSIRIDVPELPLAYRLEFRLGDDDQDATTLRVWSSLVCRRPELLHLRHALQVKLRDHVIDLGNRLACHLGGALDHRRGAGRWDGSVSRIAADPAKTTLAIPPPRRPAPGMPSPPREATTGLTAAETRLRGRLRRLIAECPADERETAAYAELHRLLNMLQHPVIAPEEPA